MERNIDRNLRAAKREARRFFGIRRRGPVEIACLIGLTMALGVYVLIERYIRRSETFRQWPDGLLVIGLFAVFGFGAYACIKPLMQRPRWRNRRRP